MSESATLQLFGFLFGSVVGSFANACIYRLPRDLSIIFPRSRCTRCGSLIRFYDNIPLLSYVLLHGRCRRCGTAFGSRYFWIELTIGGIAWWLVRTRGVGFASVYYFFFSAALVTVSAIDFEHRIIPNSISISAIGIGLVVAFGAHWIGFDWNVAPVEAVIGAVSGAGLLWGVGWAYEKVTDREGIGLGDVKLLAGFGAHAGVGGVLTSLFYGSLFGSLVGVSLVVFRGKTTKYPIPFGPFLCLGLLLYALGGQEWMYRVLTR
ncbi:MAG TPA: prepilin peptidase [Bdellovibrionota bacterium]|nr:prepilin peptidase [Bdellovibrionota bacterium]